MILAVLYTLSIVNTTEMLSSGLDSKELLRMPNLRLYEIEEQIAEEEGQLSDEEVIKKNKKLHNKFKRGRKVSTDWEKDRTHAEEE